MESNFKKMTKYFVFNSEQAAEEFCTKGCPIYGKDLEGNEVRDRGVTTRLADWVKHPTEEIWLIEYSDIFKNEDQSNLVELDKEELFPQPKMEEMINPQK